MASYQRKGKKYSKITFKKRNQLIDLVVNQGKSIAQTARKLHVKLPTAKVILGNYRKYNHVFQRKKEAIPRKKSEHDQQNMLKIQQTQRKQENKEIAKADQQIPVTPEQLGQNWGSYWGLGCQMAFFAPSMAFYGCYFPQNC